MRPVGWGIVGFGWVARDFALPAILSNRDRAVGMYDPGEAARAAAMARGIDAYASLEALLAADAVEAVYIATPNDRHREAVCLAARAGRAVLCEKPMAATLADAEAMADAVRAAGGLYGTAFDQRHHPAHAAMRAAVRDGMVGTVTSVRVVYACWLGRNWELAGAEGNWRADRGRAGGGALMDLAPHGIDLVDFLLDERIEAVSALVQSRVQDYEVDDGAVVIGRTGSGVLVSLHVAYNHPETLPRRRLEVLGTEGLLVAENTMGQEPGGVLTFRAAATGAASVLPFTDAPPFERQMAAFAASVRGVGRERFDVERDLHTMRLVARAYEAASCR